MLGSVDGKVIKELPSRYGEFVYIGHTKEQVIDSLKNGNNKNWIYFAVLMILTSISGFVLYMYGKGKWTKDVFVLHFRTEDKLKRMHLCILFKIHMRSFRKESSSSFSYPVNKISSI